MKKIILGLTCVLMLASCSIETNEKVEIESIPTKQEDEDLSAQGVGVEPLSEDIPPERIEIKRTAEVREVRLEASSKTEKKKPKVSKVRKAKEPVKVKKAKVKTKARKVAPSTKVKTKVKATKPGEKTKPVERTKPKIKTEIKATKPVEKIKPKIKTEVKTTKPIEKTKPKTKPVEKTKLVEKAKPKTKPVEKIKPTEGAIRFELTFFTTLPEHNGGWTVTATGKNLVGLNNAVASNYYPLGTKIKLDGFGTVTVMDRGGPNFNSPKRLDVLVQRKKGESNSAYTKRIWKMGRQKVNGYLTK